MSEQTGLRIEVSGLTSGVRAALPFLREALAVHDRLAPAEQTAARGRAPSRADIHLTCEDAAVTGHPDHALVMPGTIHQVIWGSASGRSPSRPSKSDRQRIGSLRRRQRLTPYVSSDRSDFELFYDRMHRPMVEQRFGELGVTESRSIARHALFDQGFIMFVCQDARPVGGMLCRVDRRTRILQARLNGILDGDDHWRRSGVLTVLHQFLADHVEELGLVGVDLSGSLPFVSRGVYQAKCKFRPEAVVPQLPTRQRRYALRPRRDLPAVRDFLVAHPMLVDRGDGVLRALYLYDAERPAAQTLRSGTADRLERDIDEVFGFDAVGPAGLEPAP